MFFIGCQSTLQSKIGMDKKVWLRRTLVADLVEAEEQREVWKSGNQFYYFENDKLVKIDQGQQQQQRYQLEIINKAAPSTQ
jgi:hypothetical protein